MCNHTRLHRSTRNLVEDAIELRKKQGTWHELLTDYGRQTGSPALSPFMLQPLNSPRLTAAHRAASVT